ncbi:MAG: GNAT family N-acetyltransferase [Solobacterium sp.]|nr:GNAT family N-acetyltransferase [Solobacterium sp.]
MIALKPFPIRYEALNDLYEHTDQSFCLNRVAVPLDEDTTRGYFLSVRTESNQGMPFCSYGIFRNDELIGKCELTRYEDGSAEADLIIRSDQVNHGYGKEALALLLKEAETNGFCECITAYIREDNIAAKHIFEQNGFEQTQSFLADVVSPDGREYRITTVKGSEYRKELQG